MLPIFLSILLDLLTQLNPFVLNQGTFFTLRLFLQKKCSFSLLSFLAPQDPLAKVEGYAHSFLIFNLEKFGKTYDALGSVLFMTFHLLLSI